MQQREKNLLTDIAEIGFRESKIEDFITEVTERIIQKYQLSGIWIYLTSLKKLSVERLLRQSKRRKHSGEDFRESFDKGGLSDLDPSLQKSIKLNLVSHTLVSNTNLVKTESKDKDKNTVGLKARPQVSFQIKDFNLHTSQMEVSNDAQGHQIKKFFKNYDQIQECTTCFELPFLRSGICVVILQKPNFETEEVKLLKRICNSMIYEVETILLQTALKLQSKKSPWNFIKGEEKVPSQTKEFQVKVFSSQSFHGELITHFKQFNLNTYLTKNFNKSFTLEDFHQSHQITLTQIEKLQSMIEKETDESSYLVFTGHQLILQDQEYVGRIIKKIESRVNPPQAIIEVTQTYVDLFSNSEILSIREKVLDIKDIGYRLIQNLFTENRKAESLKDKVIMTNRIFPSEFLQYYYQGVKGIIVVGRKESSDYITFHTKIIARSLKLGFVFLKDTDGNFLKKRLVPQTVLIDTSNSTLYLEPRETLVSKLEKQDSKVVKKQELEELRTKDGIKVQIFANVNLLAEIEQLKATASSGVGLYRSEMFFMIHNYFPNEEIQFDYYSKLQEKLRGKTLTIRTLDIGDDKILPYFPEITRENSIMGLRAIRFSLQHQSIFKVQIRALLRTADRASESNPLKITIPFIHSLDEIHTVKELFDSCLKELTKNGTVNNPHYKLGVMIELPSTLLILDALADEVDFFSVGSNDLSRYLLAVDDNDSRVRNLLTYSHPSVLRALQMIFEVANRKNIEVVQCGVMGAQKKYLEFLLGIGVRNFSIPPVMISDFVELVKKTKISHCEEKARTVLRLTTIKEIRQHLK